MVAAEAAAGGDQAGGLVARADERDHFLDQVPIVFVVADGALAGVDLFVVPALGIDAVDAEGLYLAALVLMADGGDHAAVFVIVEAAHGSGEDQDGGAAGSEDQQFHVAAQSTTVPFVIFAVHSL